MTDIIEIFYEEIRDTKFEAYGLIDSSDNIHTLGTDSKIIGRVFEIFTQPILERIAHKLALKLETPEKQNTYPDFTLLKDVSSCSKIAIDVKSTYVTDDNSDIKFTLGSYASYMRNNTKNIMYKYSDYIKHYVIGFVYKRNQNAQESRVVTFQNRACIDFPFTDVKVFIQEKYKIAGDKPGSGNTENIGSFTSKNFNDLKKGLGPFSELGADIFNLYWANYPIYRANDRFIYYKDISGFCNWALKEDNLESLEISQYENANYVLKQLNFDDVRARIRAFKDRYYCNRNF